MNEREKRVWDAAFAASVACQAHMRSEGAATWEAQAARATGGEAVCVANHALYLWRLRRDAPASADTIASPDYPFGSERKDDASCREVL